MLKYTENNQGSGYTLNWKSLLALDNKIAEIFFPFFCVVIGIF